MKAVSVVLAGFKPWLGTGQSPPPTPQKYTRQSGADPEFGKRGGTLLKNS